MTADQMPIVGYRPEQVQTGTSTRGAALKWVIVLDAELPAGRAANAAVCVAAATASSVAGLLGPGGPDGDGSLHTGLPWAGCSILAATGEQLSDLRDRAEAHPDLFVADMPSLAQETRVYDEFLDRLNHLGTAELRYYALSVIGPRKHVDKLVGRLRLLP